MAAQIPGAILGVNYYGKDNGFGLRSAGTTIRTIIMLLLLFFKTPFMAPDSAVTSSLFQSNTFRTDRVKEEGLFSHGWGLGECVGNHQVIILSDVMLVLWKDEGTSGTVQSTCRRVIALRQTWTFHLTCSVGHRRHIHCTSFVFWFFLKKYIFKQLTCRSETRRHPQLSKWWKKKCPKANSPVPGELRSQSFSCLWRCVGTWSRSGAPDNSSQAAVERVKNSGGWWGTDLVTITFRNV